MRISLRPGTLVLTLGIALLIGCNASSDSPTKAASPQPEVDGDEGTAVKSEKPAAPTEAVKSEKPTVTSAPAPPREYVLTVEGMT